MNTENQNYNPVCTITVYLNKANSTNQYYLERRIYNSNSKTFGPATPLTEQEYNEIARSIKDNSFQNGIKTKGTLYGNLLSIKYDLDGLNMVWKVKAGARKLFFDKSLNIKNDTYYLPHLIFHLKKNSLNVYATKTFNIDDNTKLYKAPFHNVSANGSVCMGNAKGDTNSVYVDEIMKSWEDAFFNSTFTHFNDTKATKLNLAEVLKQSKKTKSFNNNALVTKQMKIKEIL